MEKNFSGSYTKDDCIFLLNIEEIEELSLSEKEIRIRGGINHYSEMLSKERIPSQETLKLFDQALNLNGRKLAQACLSLAGKIKEEHGDNIVLVSLARAGTPIGVIIKKLLKETLKCDDVYHYSISVIRDKGVDIAALNYLKENHPNGNFVFIDGWTGKGVISSELKLSIKFFNENFNFHFNDNLWTISDICGAADYSYDCEDWLIPSALLNSTVSGLVSRTVFNGSKNENKFHSCKYLNDLAKYDKSNYFINFIFNLSKNCNIEKLIEKENKDVIKKTSNCFISNFLKENNLTDKNWVKIGIGESTRVLLRRDPDFLWLKEISKETEHLILLAEERNIKYSITSDLPYKAVTLIKSKD